jgi:hydrogenase maturation protease
MLSSPIILYDHPVIAAESQGSLFDVTEIDELLTLSILALPEEQKREMRHGDPRVRNLLARTESLTAGELLRLHGAEREFA